MNPDDVDVWVVDSSALIDTKKIVSVTKQWDAFKHLEQMVRDGKIAMPRQVINELQIIAHPDVPGAWASGVRGQFRHPLDVDLSHLDTVLLIAGDVVDVTKTTEDADPYVVALAVQLRDDGLKVCVVTEDTVDKISISIATACKRLMINHCGVRTFLAACGIVMCRSKNDGSS